MNVKVFATAQEAALEGARIIADVIRSQEKTVLGLATGSTPIPMYAEWIRMNRAGELSFKNVYTYNLDEYVGLPETHDQSYRYFMNHNLFDSIDIPKEHTHVPCGTGANPAEDAKHYDEMVAAAGGIDVQVLGIGHNGHIGFNEPAPVFYRGTHVVDLTERTIDANKRFFASRDDVPRQAVTLGIGGIMGAKKVVMLAFGEEKAEAVYNMLRGEIDPKAPASILQIHPDTIVLLDQGAASRL